MIDMCELLKFVKGPISGVPISNKSETVIKWHIYYEKMERILVVDNVYTWLNEDFTFLRHQLMICEIA